MTRARLCLKHPVKERPLPAAAAAGLERKRSATVAVPDTLVAVAGISTPMILQLSHPSG
jgi:hypothetical protein